MQYRFKFIGLTDTLRVLGLFLKQGNRRWLTLPQCATHSEFL